jgi:PAS domain S-box-containing protein
MTGYSKKKLLHKRISELVVAETEDFTSDRLLKIMEQGEDRFETRHRRKNRSIFDVEVSLQYQPVDGGQFIAFMRDITEHKQAEEALRQNENLLRSVMELLPIGIWILDENGKIIEGNNAGLDIWAGVRYIGMEHFGEYKGWMADTGRLIEPHEWSASRAILKGETSIDEEIEIECFDDTRKIILSSTVPLRKSDGSIRGAIVTNQDITARKKTEEALNQLNQKLENRVNERTEDLVKANTFLKQAEEKYRTVADHTYGWEFWTDRNGDFLYCSPSCERITGYTVSDFIQNPQLLHEIVHPEDLKHFKCHKQKEDKGNDGSHEINYRIVRTDGSVRWIGHVCQSIFDKNGNLIGTRGSNRDITERKNIEQLLKTNNQKYKLLSENITDGVFICKDGVFEYANKAMNYIFGYDDKELNGMKLTQLVVPDYLDELEVFHKIKVPTDRVHNIEIECFRKDLSTISVEFLMNYIAGEKVIYGVVHDITDKKQLQKNIVKAIIQTEEKERAYFSKELHDGLGPLLSTIKLYLQWSERPNTNARREEIIRQAEDIIEDALTTVKEISNKLSPHLLTNHGLSSAIQSFAGKVEQSSNIRIDFESDLKRRLDDEIEAAIYRATIECINNSIKHAKASNISILINDADSQLLLHYQDDGIGFNLEETLARKKGLGLFNLQNRIQTIGGKISMFSKPGHGVDYQITIGL